MNEDTLPGLETPSGPTDGYRTCSSYQLDTAPPLSSSPYGPAMLMLSLFVGSGGYVTPALAQVQPRSSTPRLEWSTHSTDRDAEESVEAPGRQVVLIRRWLSLNVADTARVLQVQRPTIYAWTSGDSFPTIKHRRRIEAVYKLARLWRERSAQPIGQRVRQPVVGERSLFDLLCEQRIDTGAVARAVRLLANEALTTPQSAADLARAHGFASPPERTQRRAIENETRFRRSGR